MIFKTIKLDRNIKRRVDTITLNRPDVLNATNYAMASELLQYFQSLLDSSCRLNELWTKREGRAFCAGKDIVKSDKAKKLTPRVDVSLDFGSVVGVSESLRNQKRISEMYLRMRKVKQPIVMLVKGAAYEQVYLYFIASKCNSISFLFHYYINKIKIIMKILACVEQALHLH